MFDIGAAELLVIIVVAVIVIGPKDMPLAMRMAGRWIGKVRKVSGHFRTGIDAMVREAELEDMEKKWQAQNAAIMRRSAATSEDAAGEPIMTGPPPIPRDVSGADNAGQNGAREDRGDEQTHPSRPDNRASVQAPGHSDRQSRGR